MKEFKRYDFEYKNLRHRAFERDTFKCQVCGGKGALTIHHIENFSTAEDKQLNIDNCVTLCKKCHSNFHKVFGYTNNNKQQLDEFKREYNRSKRRSSQRLHTDYVSQRKL